MSGHARWWRSNAALRLVWLPWLVILACEVVLGAGALTRQGSHRAALQFAGLACGLLLPVLALAALPALLATRKAPSWSPTPRLARALLALVLLGWVGLAVVVATEAPFIHLPPLRIDGAFTLRWVIYASAWALLVALVPVGAVAVLRPLGSMVPALVALGLSCVLVTGSGAARDQALESPALVDLALIVQRASDLDRDGSGFLLGGGDCAGFDGAVHPDARDVPHDGVDQNCDGRDARPEPRPSPKPDVPLPAELRTLRPSLLLITVDALRADRVGYAGHDEPSTPTLDALAAEATVFERAYSTSYRTWYALPALAASAHPSELGIPPEPRSGHRAPRFPDAATTLAEVASDAGLRTAFFTSFFVFDDWGIDQGMHYHQNLPVDGRDGLSAAVLNTDAAIAWLKDLPADARFFLWIHYSEPHLPYVTREHDFGPDGPARYDSEVRHVDDQLARLLASIDRASTVVAVTADHGEGLGERGVHGHTAGLYEFLVRVPLLIAVPGQPPRRVEAPASILDLAPTLAALAGLEAPSTWTGRAQIGAVTGRTVDVERRVFAADPLSGKQAVYGRSGWLLRDPRRGQIRWHPAPGAEALRDAYLEALLAWSDRVHGGL